MKLDGLVSGKIIYKNYYIDISTGKRIRETWKDWFESLDFSISTFFVQPKVVHLFYELGFFFHEIHLETIKEDTILAIEINYKNFSKYNPSKEDCDLRLKNILSPNYQDYEKKFNEGYKHLVAGNCYQFNLTENFKYKFSAEDPTQIIDKLWSHNSARGKYGSATYIPLTNMLYLSNSPECLFQIEENKIISRPIKGTVKIKKSIDEHWNELIHDQKNKSELFMIIDLIRNDLSSIEKPNSIITQKQAPLIVPGILHQYGEVQALLSDRVKMKTIIEKIFPGGSITGAPKKRSMEILRNLENRERGFYCGSTMILFKEMKAASINIRSSEIDLKLNQLNYSAGGGITLKSESNSEFLELSYKENSYISLLTP